MLRKQSSAKPVLKQFCTYAECKEEYKKLFPLNNI